MKLLIIFGLAVLCAGCVLDSVEPWLSPDTIVETSLELDGKWTVLDEVELFGGGSETVVTLTHKPATSRAKEFFYIEIKPKKRDAHFMFRATVHEIQGLRFLQISNFTHSDDRIYALANRATYALWRVEADADNIIIWTPDLGREAAGLKTLRDQDDKALFVDTTSNNVTAIREWARSYRLANERPSKILPLALTRTGTEFVLPVSAEPHMPADLNWPKHAAATPSTAVGGLSPRSP